MEIYFPAFFFILSFIQRHQSNFSVRKCEESFFAKLWRQRKEKVLKLWAWNKNGLFVLPIIFKKLFSPPSSQPATTLLINSGRKLFSASIFHLNIQTITVMEKVWVHLKSVEAKTNCSRNTVCLPCLVSRALSPFMYERGNITLSFLFRCKNV